MGIFDSIQDMLGGAADLAQGSIGDVASSLTDNPVVQDLQEQASTVADGATDAVASAGEQGQTAIEDVSQNLGLK